MKPDLVVAAKQIDKSDNANDGIGSKNNDKNPGENSEEESKIL